MIATTMNSSVKYSLLILSVNIFFLGVLSHTEDKLGP